MSGQLCGVLSHPFHMELDVRDPVWVEKEHGFSRPPPVRCHANWWVGGWLNLRLLFGPLGGFQGRRPVIRIAAKPPGRPRFEASCAFRLSHWH